MDTEKVKRGIDFSNRVGECKLTDRYKKSLAWWKGSKLNKKTFVYIAVVFIINLIIIMPLFGRDVRGSFVSSAVFMLIADFFKRFLFLDNIIFFKIITIFSLALSPITF